MTKICKSAHAHISQLSWCVTFLSCLSAGGLWCHGRRAGGSLSWLRFSKQSHHPMWQIHRASQRVIHYHYTVFSLSNGGVDDKLLSCVKYSTVSHYWHRNETKSNWMDKLIQMSFTKAERLTVIVFVKKIKARAQQ